MVLMRESSRAIISRFQQAHSQPSDNGLRGGGRFPGHCKRYRATGPHRAGVDVDVTPPTGGPVGHPPNPATLCDRSAQGSKS